MKTTLYMVISANGYIAKEDGSEDWISEDNWKESAQIMHKFANVIFGRRAWDNLKTWDKQYLDDIEDVQKIIVSSEPHKPSDNNLGSKVMFAISPQKALETLSEMGFN